MAIAASVRHETGSILERCFHRIMLLRQPDDAGKMTAAGVVGELEAELRLLEESIRKLDVALGRPVRNVHDG
jgi:hypothetical protein